MVRKKLLLIGCATIRGDDMSRKPADPKIIIGNMRITKETHAEFVKFKAELKKRGLRLDISAICEAALIKFMKEEYK